MIPTVFNFAMRDSDPCGTYGDDLRSNEREGSLSRDAPPSDKSACGSRNVMVLDERTGVFPVAEADPGTDVRIEEITQERGNLTCRDQGHLQGQELLRG